MFLDRVLFFTSVLPTIEEEVGPRRDPDRIPGWREVSLDTERQGNLESLNRFQRLELCRG